MKRDMNLVRELLLKLEMIGSNHRFMTFKADHEAIAVDGYSPEEIDYHLSLIWGHGLVEIGGRGSGIGAGGDYIFGRLSWSGHDLIDSIRDPEVWRKTKEGASKAGSWTVQLLVDVAKAYTKQKLNEVTGLNLA